MKCSHRILAGLGVLSLSACAPVNLLNTITPSGGFDKISDVSFADHDRLTLDIYQPKDRAVKTPVVVFVHGGSWESGSKDIYKFMGDGLTSEGYEAVIPNYRLHPGISFPDPVSDTAKAVAWAAEEYPDRPLVLMGHSAGAYNVLMTAMDDQFLSAEGVDGCARIAGVVSLAAPVGIVPLKEEPYITIFPDRFTADDAPLNQADNRIPPLFLVNGDKDESVYPQNAEALADKVSARGGKAEARIYPGVNHIDPVKFFSRYFDGDSTLKSDVVVFIDGLALDKTDFCH